MVSKFGEGRVFVVGGRLRLVLSTMGGPWSHLLLIRCCPRPQSHGRSGNAALCVKQDRKLIQTNDLVQGMNSSIQDAVSIIMLWASFPSLITPTSTSLTLPGNLPLSANHCLRPTFFHHITPNVYQSSLKC